MKKRLSRFFLRVTLSFMLLASSLNFVPPGLRSVAEATDAKPAEQIHYTITGPDSVTFDWVYGPATIQFGETATYGQSVKAGDPIIKPRYPVDGMFREAKLTGLKPNTTYHYTIDDSKDYTFRTAPVAGSSGFSIVTTGDVGAAIRFQNAGLMNNLIASLNADLYLGLGDFTYGDQEGLASVSAHFNDVMVWSRETPYMPNWGNHEWQSAHDDLTNYKGRFNLPNAQVDKGMSSSTPTYGVPGDWYWFDYGNTRFIAFPEPFGNTSWSKWTEEAAVIMAQAETDNKIKFVVTFGHRPTYSSGYHGSNPDLADLMEVLAKKYPKFVLNLIAHDHHYERTVPEKTFGVLHVVVGTGGSTLSSEKDTECKFKNCTPPSWSAERFYHFGALKLDFKDDEIQGNFVCGPSISAESIKCNSGELGDSFTIKSRILKPDPGAVMQGSGSVEDPYVVMTAQDLYNIRNKPAAQYKLGGNLDLTFFDAGDGKGWMPIDPTGSNRFSGGFDGNGFIINGLTIKRPTSDHSALFGYTGNSAKIKNVALENVHIEGRNFVGALVSYQSGDGSIKNSYATGEVIGTSNVGGIGGEVKVPISDSFARVNVTGTDKVGGLVGSFTSSAFNTYSTGKVVGTSNVGGLIGINTGSASSSYWDILTSGQVASAGGGEGKTTAGLKKKATYVNWDFTFVWQIDEGKDYPLLSGSVPPASTNANLSEIKLNGSPVSGFSPGRFTYDVIVPYSISYADVETMTMDEKAEVKIIGEMDLKVGENSITINVMAADKINTQNYALNIIRGEPLMSGAGTYDNPYKIKTAQELNKIRMDKSAYYKLTADIDLNNFDDGDGKGWMPIGVDKSRFIGKIDGNGHVINGLKVDRSDTDFASLLGYVTWGGSIQNVGLTNVDVKGKNYVGGLVGYMDGDGEIRNSFVTGKINATSSNAGGIGGDVRVSIYNSYVHANVVGNNRVGGLIGRMQSSSSAVDLQINTTYFTGTVSSPGAFVGGFISELAAGKIINSYWNAETAGQTAKACSVDNLIESCGVGKMTADMKQQATYVGWDFTSRWVMGQSGYPELQRSEQPEEPILSTNADLKALTVDGVTVNEFEANLLSYAMDVPYSKASVTIAAAAADAKATVAGDGQIDLSVGSNTIAITVTAESGMKKIYQIIIKRAKEISTDYQKSDVWKMVEPGAGGAFFSVGAGPSSEKYPYGIAVAGSDLSGPYLSYDNGKTWENRGYWNGLIYHNHTSMVGYIPDDANVLFVGAEDIMYKSNDGGHQFYPILSEDWDPFERTGTFKVVRDLKPGEIGTKYKDPLGDVHDQWAEEPLEEGALLYFTAMTFSKSNPNIGYVAAHHNWEGTDAVIFKTTDRGETWSPVKAFLNDYDDEGNLVKFNENMRVQKIVVDYTNPNSLYILSQPDQFTEETGLYWEGPKSAIYKSVNGGVDWELVAGDMHTNPANSGAAGLGLPLYDVDGQQKFILHSSGEYRTAYQKSGDLTEPLFMRYVSDFELDPIDPNVLYVSKGNRSNRTLPGTGVYKGTFNNGTWSWEKLMDTFGIVKVKAVDNHSIVRLFDIRGWSDTQPSAQTRNYPKVYEYSSANAANGFELIAEASTPGTFELGAIHHYYSTSPAYVKTIAASMANPDVYFWVDSQWVFMSDDGARHFKSASSNKRTDEHGDWYSTTGVSNVVSLTLKISEANPNIIYTGNSDIGFWRSMDNGRFFQHANQAQFVSDWKGIGGQAQAILADPDRENVVWAGLGGYYIDQILVKSTEYGANGSWIESHSGLPKSDTPRWNNYQNGAAIRGLSLDRTSPINNRTLYVVADDVVFKSTDDGVTWSKVLDMREATDKEAYEYDGNETWDVNPDRTAATAVDPTNGNYVYAGGSDGFFRSADAGATWERIGGIEFEGIQKIIVSRQNSEHVFVAVGPYQNDDWTPYNSPGLYRSTDRGETWELIFEDEFVRGFDVNPQDENIIIVGSSNVWIAGGIPESSGAWLTVDGGETWHQVNEGLSWPYVRDVEMNPHDPTQVFIVTPGTSFHVRTFDYDAYLGGNEGSPFSSNADLDSLTLTAGTWNTPFSLSNQNYTIDVSHSVSSVELIAEAAEEHATISVNGTEYTSGTANVINLNVGENTIAIVVTAQNGTEKTYTIIVKRAAAPNVDQDSGDKVIVAPPAGEGRLTLPAGSGGTTQLGEAIIITIPAGATSQELKLTVEKVLDGMKLVTAQQMLLSPIFEILKNFSGNFIKAITLTFAFDANKLNDNQKASVFYYDEVMKVWVEIGGKINGDKISVEVDHFTKFAVFAVDKKVASETLSDISSHWAKANIELAVTKGIVNGYPNGTFKPDGDVTRAEFAVMLARTLNLQGAGAKLSFTDQGSIGKWAQLAIAQAVEAGIITGYTDGSFRPNAKISRAEMMTMVTRALGYALDNAGATSFADDADIPLWAKAAVKASAEAGIIQGRGGNRFVPNGSATRAEAVTVLLGALELNNK